ncbi:hypothetical protein GCM10010495_76660 [Kitasatospora herbaricolor]|uniref:hypothetical protein n=1 Tax=Kitasatospora herbaricolor TaxID=68217 RepID=UPI00174E98D4|nr:hypothetical protein [Kitasatospora herbaricolor]MDQ0305519.1 hypothetical protein [Kitasatospora herbaricolor]GGV47639.1 hypothetical protein GCM10010495_76660 [Kitasatospora herbaricolor]
MTKEDPHPDRGTLPPARTATALAERSQDQELQLMVRRAAACGELAEEWLRTLGGRRPWTETGAVLADMAHAVGEILGRYALTDLPADQDETDRLNRRLDLYFSPAGCLLAPLTDRSEPMTDPELATVLLLTGCARTALAMTTIAWERDLPALLTVMEFALDQAGPAAGCADGE